MVDYKIAIPSYKRVDTLMAKTLKYLQSTDVNMKKVTVFVADKREAKAYANVGVKVVVGKPSLMAQRNFMRRYYEPGTNVLFIDDDVEGLYHAPSAKREDLRLVEQLDRFVCGAFDDCIRFGITLWGVSAVLNPFFMAGKGVSFDLKYIIGAFYGEVIDHSRSYDVTIEDKEDFERTIKHFIVRGSVYRHNSYSIKTNYYKEPGGMQETRTKERVRESAYYLAQKYPKYCKINTSKKNKEFVEIKLIKQ